MKNLILVILVLFLATGCAVYTPAPYYYGGAYPYYYSQYPYYGHYDYGGIMATGITQIMATGITDIRKSQKEI